MTIAIVEDRSFEGPNIWLDRPVVRVVLHGVRNAPGAARLAISLAQLEAALDHSRHAPLPLLIAPADADPARWLGWGAVSLQRLAGDDIESFFVRPLEDEGESELVVECRHRQTGLLAIRLALQEIISLSARRRTSFHLATAFDRQLASVAASRRPDSSSGCILDAAKARGVPIVKIDPRGRIHELGTGIYRQRLFNTKTSQTSWIGEMISSNKHLSLHYLRECGLPVPDTFVARDAGRAVEQARAIGFPVVVKPIDEGDAAGVHVDLHTESEVRSAFTDAAAISESGTVVVQRYLIGKEYRLLVVGKQIVAALHRVPAHVTGDGTHSIRELVEIENQNPRRGMKKTDPLKRIEIGAKAVWMLERQGLALDDVPASGKHVQLNPTGHISSGGEAIEMTAAVHPDNVEIVVAAARALDVDIAGIDLIAENIERSIWETSGGIVEVNCGPGFWTHQYPSAGAAIDPGPAIVDTLFPPGAPVRIPVIAVTGSRETAEVSRLIGHMLTAAGHAAGVALRDGLYLGETFLRGIECGGVQGARRILLNPAVEMAVLEIPPDEIVSEGLAFEQCDVAVVTSLSGASPAGLPVAESVVCRTVAPDGMLIVAGDDPAAIEFARVFDRPLVLYGVEPSAGSATNHWRAGDRSILLRENGGRTVLDIDWGIGHPATCAVPVGTGTISHAALAAIGAALALGVAVEHVRRIAVDMGPGSLAR